MPMSECPLCDDIQAKLAEFPITLKSVVVQLTEINCMAGASDLMLRSHPG
jgi:hypothetical protein